MTVYLAGGGASSAMSIGQLPSGTFIVPVTNGASNRSLSANGSGNVDTGCHLFVPYTQRYDQIGANVTIAGDAAAVIFLSLYQQLNQTLQYSAIIPEQQINVGAATGIIFSTINVVLPAGHYMAWARSTYTSPPNVTGVTVPAGGLLFAWDSGEASSDLARGGIHVGILQSSGYTTGAPPPSYTISGSSFTRSGGPRLFLRAA